jgi:hypothetical protein
MSSQKQKELESFDSKVHRLNVTYYYSIMGGILLYLASVNMQHIEKLSMREQQMSTKMQQIIEWRRAKVMELLSKGESNQSEIARVMQVDKSIICRDIAYLR